MKIFERFKKSRSHTRGHVHHSDTLRKLQEEIGLIRKHLDCLSEKVAWLADPDAENNEPEPTVTISQCEQLNTFLEIKEPRQRWFQIAFFFDQYKSVPELQTQLLNIFCIDWSLHNVETHGEAADKRRYSGAYQDWNVIVLRHRKAALLAMYIRSNCTDENHECLLTVFNHLNDIEDKMVYLYSFFSHTRGASSSLHSHPASMEWMSDNPNRQFPEFDGDADRTESDAADDTTEVDPDEDIVELERRLKPDKHAPEDEASCCGAQCDEGTHEA